MPSRLPDTATKYEWRDCYSAGNAIIDQQHIRCYYCMRSR